MNGILFLVRLNDECHLLFPCLQQNKGVPTNLIGVAYFFRGASPCMAYLSFESGCTGQL